MFGAYVEDAKGWIRQLKNDKRFSRIYVAGHSEVSIALGGRFKLNDCWQFGLGVEVPLTGNRDLQAYRVTADLIFRY